MHGWNKDTKIGRKTKELKFYSFVSLPDILLFHTLSFHTFDILLFHTLPQICNLRYNDTQAEKKSGAVNLT